MMLGRRASLIAAASAQARLLRDTTRTRPSKRQPLAFMGSIPVGFASGSPVEGTRPPFPRELIYFIRWRGAGLPDFAPSAWISSCSRFMVVAIGERDPLQH